MEGWRIRFTFMRLKKHVVYENTQFQNLARRLQNLVFSLSRAVETPLNAVNIWNDVPDDIKACLTKASFKYNYKNYLLNQYNN